MAASNLPGWIASGEPFYRLLYGLTLSGQMICFMLIGVVFNFLHRGLVSAAIAIVAIAFFFTAFAVQWPLGPIRSSSSIGVLCYATALATFGLMFVLRGRIRAPKALSWLADISYPLYVIHGFAGYVIMRVLYDLGVSVAGCIAIACAFSFLAAQVLHVLVERPSQDLVRSIQVGRLFRREATKVALGGDRPQAFR